MIPVNASRDDLFLVGTTLRLLARANPQAGESLERVGVALINASKPRAPRVRGERGCI